MATLPEKADSDIQMRLRRIEGQIRGIIGMLADGKSCEQVVTQILAARAALDGVAMEVLRCQVDEAMTDKPPAEAREVVLRAINLLNRV
ncbi:MAG: metal-sensitive transcriptional regulator [Ktedonobacterales bacterium]